MDPLKPQIHRCPHCGILLEVTFGEHQEFHVGVCPFCSKIVEVPKDKELRDEDSQVFVEERSCAQAG